MPHKQHILIVDDNLINRQYFSMSLKKANFDITSAENGFEAIELSLNINFDLILMDIRMPEIDGYETAKRIRLTPYHNETPILATSAEEISSEMRKCFNDFLLKPISPKLLTQQVRKYCLDNLNKIVFNREDALKYAYNDKDIMHKLIDMFVIDLPKQMALLDECIAIKSTNDCIDIIHKIRGSCKACGAQELDNQLEIFSNSIKNNEISIACNYEKTKKAVNEYLIAIQK